MQEIARPEIRDAVEISFAKFINLAPGSDENGQSARLSLHLRSRLRHGRSRVSVVGSGQCNRVDFGAAVRRTYLRF